MPTVSVSIDGVRPRAAAEALGARRASIAWDGDFYATGLIERLGKAEVGGVLRLGLVHYNTAAEVDRTLEALGRIAAGPEAAVADPTASIRRRLARRSTRPSCAGSSGCGCATRSPRTRRDIDGLIATLTPTTASTRSSRPASAGRATPARGRSTRELFAAFPDNAFALSEIVIGPQGVFEVATLTGTNQGPWAGVAADRAGGLARGADPVPLGPRHGAVHRGADLVRPRLALNRRTRGGRGRPAVV